MVRTARLLQPEFEAAWAVVCAYLVKEGLHIAPGGQWRSLAQMRQTFHEWWTTKSHNGRGPEVPLTEKPVVLPRLGHDNQWVTLVSDDNGRKHYHSREYTELNRSITATIAAVMSQTSCACCRQPLGTSDPSEIYRYEYVARALDPLEIYHVHKACLPADGKVHGQKAWLLSELVANHRA